MARPVGPKALRSADVQSRLHLRHREGLHAQGQEAARRSTPVRRGRTSCPRARGAFTRGALGTQCLHRRQQLAPEPGRNGAAERDAAWGGAGPGQAGGATSSSG